MSLTSNEKGARTEGAVLAALLRFGYSVLIPFGVSRYDLVIETPDGFKRVQCKTARLVQHDTAIAFNVASNPPSGQSRTYEGEVDYFGVYAPGLDRVYLVPIEEVADRKRQVWLRVKPGRNNQVARTRDAENFRLVAQSDRALVS